MICDVRCAQIMPGCQAVIEGRDKAEVMARLMEHVIKDHKIAAPPFELVTRAHAAIRTRSALTAS
jgi:predicted small metal-binding protein